MSNLAAADSSSADSSAQFQYDDETLEVVIIENGDNDRDGYVEANAAVKLLAPLVNIRNFSKSILWTNALPSQKLTRNNKNYVHVFTLCRYLSTYNLNTPTHFHQYYVLKRLVSDLIVGAQSQLCDPLSDLKTQLCDLRECLNVSGGGGANNNTVYQPTANAVQSLSSSSSSSESLRDTLRMENANLLNNINTSFESIRAMQMDLANKLAFSNDTMLDSLKSIKDIVIRKNASLNK